LTKKEISQIVDILLNELQSRLVDRNIKLVVSKEVKEYVVEKGFDPVLGARPLRRSVQRLIEDNLAEEFLNDKFHDGDAIDVTLDGDTVNFKKIDREESA
jgi:ATP-dependent Clp protease ATP-binding subunit ClpC